MLGFISNLVFGKVDERPIYEGMREWDKRNADKRKAFLYAEMSKWRKEKERLLADYKEKKSKGLGVDQVLEKFCEAAIFETLYDKGTSLAGSNAEQDRKTAIETVLKQMPEDFSPSHPAWINAVASVKRNSAVQIYLPGLFDTSAQLIWDRIVVERTAEAERRRKAEEARKQKEAEERERRAKLREVLRNLEAERSRLMSMFSSMPSGSMNRMQITVAIDAMDQQISRLRQEIG